jgi:hypothetical protein
MEQHANRSQPAGTSSPGPLLRGENSAQRYDAACVWPSVVRHIPNFLSLRRSPHFFFRQDCSGLNLVPAVTAEHVRSKYSSDRKSCQWRTFSLLETTQRCMTNRCFWALVRQSVPAQPVDATPSNALIRQCFPGRSDLFGCPRSKPSQGSVPTDLTLASDLAFVFNTSRVRLECCVDPLRPPTLALSNFF